MIQTFIWWFCRLVFRFMKATTGIEHVCYFWESEVRNINMDPRCVHCGQKLSEAVKKNRENDEFSRQNTKE